MLSVFREQKEKKKEKKIGWHKAMSFPFALAGTNSEPNALSECCLLNLGGGGPLPLFPPDNLCSDLPIKGLLYLARLPAVHSVGKA